MSTGYPAELRKIHSITVTGQELEPISLYMDVIRKLYETDLGLNDEITTISVDLSRVSGMNNS